MHCSQVAVRVGSSLVRHPVAAIVHFSQRHIYTSWDYTHTVPPLVGFLGDASMGPASVKNDLSEIYLPRTSDVQTPLRWSDDDVLQGNFRKEKNKMEGE